MRQSMMLAGHLLIGPRMLLPHANSDAQARAWVRIAARDLSSFPLLGDIEKVLAVLFHP